MARGKSGKKRKALHAAGPLKDHDGNTVSAADLSEEIAGAKVGTVRQVISGHPADGMTPVKLARILRAAAEGEPEAYFELAEDIEERDPHYLSVLATRKRSVSQLPITVKPASDSAEHKKHAELLQKWVDKGVLRANLFDILDAIGKGLSVTEIDWKFDKGLQAQLPHDLIWRTQRWFTFDKTDGETVLLREGVAGEPLLQHKFIVHRHKTKSGLTIRSGIARVAVWLWMFKSFTAKDWAIFCQNYGQPIRVGRYGRGATEKEKDVLWRAVANIAGDCAAIMPNEMKVEFVDVGSKTASTDMYEKRADWHDRQTSKLVLGQTTTTDAVSGGHAVSQEHRLVQEDIERDDAGTISATLQLQLVPLIIALNFGPQDVYPQLRIGRPDEIPLKEFAEAFDKLAPHGLTAEASYLQDRLGIPAPRAGAVLVGGRPPVPADPAGDLTVVPPKPRPKPDQSVHSAFDRLFSSSHARTDDEDLIDILGSRLQRDAAGAMSGMLDQVRKELMAATDLRDAADRLARLDLSPDELADAMAQGMALAHLAGQSSLMDDLRNRN